MLYPFAMRVRVLLFGVLKDLLLSCGEMLELPEGSTVEALVDYYRGRHPAQSPLWPSLAVAVNCEYASWETILSEGDEVALLPPVSGGSGSPSIGMGVGSAARVELVRQPLSAGTIGKSVQRSEDGALVIFDGVVRDNTRGRRTLYLEYESYEEMALRTMQTLAADALTLHGVRQVALVHRLGRIEVGETSVVIAVASAHRAQAFEACRWLIDTLKKTVPIWKKEYFADGAVWADGEPFPPAIPAKGTP